MSYITVNEGDGYKIRAKRINPSKGNKFMGRAYEFVVVEWEHPNYGYFADAMFWWRSMHTHMWTPVPVVS